jgi:hypothetical protein
MALQTRSRACHAVAMIALVDGLALVWSIPASVEWMEHECSSARPDVESCPTFPAVHGAALWRLLAAACVVVPLYLVALAFWRCARALRSMAEDLHALQAEPSTALAERLPPALPHVARALLRASLGADAVCPLTLERMRALQRVAVMPCYHMADKDSLFKWATSRRFARCPLCNALIGAPLVLDVDEVAQGAP